MSFEYPVIFHTDRNGTIIAAVPSVPGTMTVGADRAEALRRVRGALIEMLAARVEDGESIPRASRPGRGQRTVEVSPLAAAKLSVYQAMRGRKWSRLRLARRLGWEEARLQRLLDPRRRSSLEDVEAALEALGKRLVIEIRNDIRNAA